MSQLMELWDGCVNFGNVVVIKILVADKAGQRRRFFVDINPALDSS